MCYGMFLVAEGFCPTCGNVRDAVLYTFKCRDRHDPEDGECNTCDNGSFRKAGITKVLHVHNDENGVTPFPCNVCTYASLPTRDDRWDRFNLLVMAQHAAYSNIFSKQAPAKIFDATQDVRELCEIFLEMSIHDRASKMKAINLAHDENGFGVPVWLPSHPDNLQTQVELASLEQGGGIGQQAQYQHWQMKPAEGWTELNASDYED